MNTPPNPFIYWQCLNCGTGNEDIPELKALFACRECGNLQSPGISIDIGNRDFVTRYRGQSAVDFDVTMAEAIGVEPTKVRSMRNDLTDGDYREDVADRIAAAIFYLVRETEKFADQKAKYIKNKNMPSTSKWREERERDVGPEQAYGAALFRARLLYRRSF